MEFSLHIFAVHYVSMYIDAEIDDEYGHLCISVSTYVRMYVNEWGDFTAGLSGINLTSLETIWISSTF